jgi:hypothetical protein
MNGKNLEICGSEDSGIIEYIHERAHIYVDICTQHGIRDFSCARRECKPLGFQSRSYCVGDTGMLWAIFILTNSKLILQTQPS